MTEERRDERERRAADDEKEDVEGHRKSVGAADEPQAEGEGDDDVEAHRKSVGRHAEGG
jgi:hypothetical protein